MPRGALSEGMSTGQTPLVYIILGAAGSDRRVVLRDLIEGGLSEGESSVVLLTARDAVGAPEFGRMVEWTWEGDHAQIPPDAIGEATHVFLVSDGRLDPVDQIEAFKPWIEQTGGSLARIITVVNCRLAEAHREVVAWYEACIHFSDVVLLAHREGVANKWMSEFQGRFRDLFYPCLFEFVKEGRVKNPPLILEPEARRMSHFFDEPDWEVLGEDDEAEDDEDAEKGDSEEEVEMVPESDPYMDRWAGGRRVKELPNIAKFLPGPSETSSAQTDGPA
jgi:hypothetical protein